MEARGCQVGLMDGERPWVRGSERLMEARVSQATTYRIGLFVSLYCKNLPPGEVTPAMPTCSHTLSSACVPSVIVYLT